MEKREQMGARDIVVSFYVTTFMVLPALLWTSIA